MPARYQSEDLAAAVGRDQAGRAGAVGAGRPGRELLREQLAAACAVEQIAVYAQVDAVENDEEILNVRRGEIEFVTLTSSNVARVLLSRLDATCQRRIETGEIKLVSISPVTSAEIGKLGYIVAAEAEAATADGVIEARSEAGRRGAESSRTCSAAIAMRNEKRGIKNEEVVRTTRRIELPNS